MITKRGISISEFLLSNQIDGQTIKDEGSNPVV